MHAYCLYWTSSTSELRIGFLPPRAEHDSLRLINLHHRVIDFFHLDSSLIFWSLARCSSLLAVIGVHTMALHSRCRIMSILQGSIAPRSTARIMDFFHLGTSLALRSLARCGSSLAIIGFARYGSSLSVLDFGQLATRST